MPTPPADPVGPVVATTPRVLFALWDRELGNQLGVFPSGAEALLAVRQLLAIGAPISGDALLLEYEDDQGTATSLSADRS